MSFNYLLIWFAGIGGFFAAIRTRGRQEAELQSVFYAALLALGSLCLGLALFPDVAGYVAIIPWVLGVLGPQIFLRKIVGYYEKMEIARGERLISKLQLFPWMNGWLKLWLNLFEAERILREDGNEPALQILTPNSQTNSLAALYARGRMLSLLGAWNELLLFSRQFSLGKSGKPSLFFSTLTVLALGALNRWNDAKKIIDLLREHFEPGSEERAQLLRMLHEVSPPEVVREVEDALAEESVLPKTSRFPKVVIGLSAFLLIAFLFSQFIGESLSLQALRFDPIRILLFHEWWRTVTCTLVHADILHVCSNVLGVVILGPFLAQQLGSLRFVVLFFLSALGASLIMLALMWFSVIPPSPLVGASGGVMGIVGGYLGYYGASYLRSGSLYHKEQIRGVLLIVGIQTLFDLSTPQVSFLAHFGGFLSGVFSYVLLTAIPSKNTTAQ